MNDLDFLREVYDDGGAAFFDIVAARLDGGARTPYDRRTDANEPSLSRAILMRSLLRQMGDAAKPIWATHYGWNADPSGASHLDERLQADNVVAGLERARAEWPWMGPLFQWGLIPGPDPGARSRRAETARAPR